MSSRGAVITAMTRCGEYPQIVTVLTITLRRLFNQLLPSSHPRHQPMLEVLTLLAPWENTCKHGVT